MVGAVYSMWRDMCVFVFFFKQKTAYEVRMSDWSSDVCSSDLGYSPTPPAACAWSAHSPSKPTKTGSKPTATSIWTNCASRRKPNYAKPHDQHHDRQFAELDAHNQRRCRHG